jgi:YrbI family 3-deoxy-D-manno-octulosonate 8-phosphate phosphatase
MLTTELLSTVELIAFDFDGVFTDNTVLVSQDGIESVRCWRSDGLGLSRVAALGVYLLIISTEENPVVGVRAKKLKLPCKQAVEDKAKAILQTCKEKGVNPAKTMFVGNDINDIQAFRAVGMPVAVADAHPEVYPYVLFITKTLGGQGAVREICDMVFSAKSRH